MSLRTVYWNINHAINPTFLTVGIFLPRIISTLNLLHCAQCSLTRLYVRLVQGTRVLHNYTWNIFIFRLIAESYQLCQIPYYTAKQNRKEESFGETSHAVFFMSVQTACGLTPR